MTANYYTLRHIAIQLNQQLNGWTIREVFSQNKNELIVAFEQYSDRVQTMRLHFLIINCVPSENSVIPTESFARARKNSIDLLPEIVGQRIKSISIHQSDRQIALETISGLRLMIQMFGSRANVMLVQPDNVIVNSFLRSKEFVGQILTERVVGETFADERSTLQRLPEFQGIPIGVAIKKLFPLFGSVLWKELFVRSGMDQTTLVDRLSDDQIQHLVRDGKAMKKELESICKPRIYYEGPNAIEFGIIDLQQCGQYEKKEFDSLGVAIRTYLGAAKRVDRDAREKSRIQLGLNKELERVSRTLAKISEESDSTDRGGDYERLGELLKAHLHELSKGMKEAILVNTIDGSNELVAVPMDPNLTPARNADRYFERAKKSRTAVEEKKKQTERLTRERSALLIAVQDLETIGSSEEMGAFVEAHHDTLHPLGLVRSTQSKKSAEAEVPFRVFRVSGNFVVWAGKSGENNDLLSTRYTKSKDLWFHARSVGGSHVVLKFGSGKGEISKHAIDEAAGIAAYYSKMKGSKLVPVSVCEGKYVRKPKGVPAGTVTIDHEKVIFVVPRLPVTE